MRYRKLGGAAAIATSVFFLCLFAGARSLANSCTSPLVTTCINDDTFWPHPGPSQLLAVGGAETTAKGQVGFGLVTTYLSRPIVLHIPSPGPGGSDQYAINDQVNGNFLFSYGVTDRLELGVVLPVTFGQGGAGASPITGGAGISDTASRDLRFGFAYAIVPRSPRVQPWDHPTETTDVWTAQTWALTGRLEISTPTGDSDQFAGERTAVFAPSVAADLRRKRFFGGIELGARIRPSAEIVGARVGSQALGGIGGGLDILPREVLSVALEARAIYNFPEQHESAQTVQGLVSTPNGKHIVPAEWGPSIRSAPIAAGDISFQAGAAFPFVSDPPILTPRWRFTLGIRYAPLARDSDGDGVLDKNDLCPYTKALPVEGFPHDGCPHEAPATAPAGGEDAPLDLRGSTRCAEEPDTVDGFRDTDGCPDEDTDKDGIDDRMDKCPLAPEDYSGLAEGCPK
jgi:hypothetical protein